MKARILNESGYPNSFPGMPFPIEVEASLDPRYPQCLFVHQNELLRVGGNAAWAHFSDDLGSPMVAFLIGEDAEVIS